MLTDADLEATRDAIHNAVPPWEYSGAKVKLSAEAVMNIICEVDHLREELSSIKACVDEQAEDPALWLIQPTITEAYLQQELRRLHAVIEGEVLPGAEKEAT